MHWKVLLGVAALSLLHPGDPGDPQHPAGQDLRVGGQRPQVRPGPGDDWTGDAGHSSALVEDTPANVDGLNIMRNDDNYWYFVIIMIQYSALKPMWSLWEKNSNKVWNICLNMKIIVISVIIKLHTRVVFKHTFSLNMKVL